METAEVQWDNDVFSPEDVSTPRAHNQYLVTVIEPRMQVPSTHQP